MVPALKLSPVLGLKRGIPGKDVQTKDDTENADTRKRDRKCGRKLGRGA
jgi:hypothetical protein